MERDDRADTGILPEKVSLYHRICLSHPLSHRLCRLPHLGMHNQESQSRAEGSYLRPDFLYMVREKTWTNINNNRLTSRSFASSQINLVVLEAMTIAETEVTMYYLIGLMLTDFFALAAMWFTLYVFWELIHRFLGLTRPSGKPHAAVTTIHYVFLGIVFLVSVAEWGVRVAYYVWSVNFNYELSWTLTQVSCAVYIIHWVLSTEILAWVFFLAIKAGNNAFASKVNPTAILPTKNEPTNWPFQLPAMALFTAAISWCAVCATVAIIGIRYSLLPVYQYDRPVYLSTAISIVEFFLYVGTYTGILLCCAKWHSLGDERKYSAPQYQPQYPVAQFSPGQFSEGQYPPIQQQSYGVAPYTDHSAQPQAHPHHVSPR
jgi:hypothetical protein